MMIKKIIRFIKGPSYSSKVYATKLLENAKAGDLLIYDYKARGLRVYLTHDEIKTAG